jgi:hypothetical protein
MPPAARKGSTHVEQLVIGITLGGSIARAPRQASTPITPAFARGLR